MVYSKIAKGGSKSGRRGSRTRSPSQLDLATAVPKPSHENQNIFQASSDLAKKASLREVAVKGVP
jgi:hypothetical protein